MTALLLSLGSASAQAKKENYAAPPTLTPEQNVLVERAIAAEKRTVATTLQKAPLVQAYIQNMKADRKLYSAPVSDQYFLQRINFEKTFPGGFNSVGGAEHGEVKGSLAAIDLLSKSILPDDLRYLPGGFLRMLFIDPKDFDQQHYDFVFVRKAFLSTIRCDVFDVHPKKGLGVGRFTGRIWVDVESGNVARFMGTYTTKNMTQRTDGNDYFYFDSWRQNLQPEIWLPVQVYVERTSKVGNANPVAFKAHIQVWGYSLKVPTHESDNESVLIDDELGALGVTDLSANSEPLQAQREWIARAEDNVLDRLTQAGLLAPPSDFDKILEQITNNIIIGNNLELSSPVRCRVMLTTPLESIAVGNTIILSKGLVDTLPSEESLAVALSFQLAHIVLGHHIDTSYAFRDRVLSPDESTFERIRMQHTNADNIQAANKAVALLDKSIYKDKLDRAGLYFAQLQERAKELSALNTPQLGDSLLDSAGQPWMFAIQQRAPKLDQYRLNQIAALPLGSRLGTDSWDDRVDALKTKSGPLLNAEDKMPFQLQPVLVAELRYPLARNAQTQTDSSTASDAQIHTPDFRPWPPPKSSGLYVIPSEVLNKGGRPLTLGEVEKRLSLALEAEDYTERRYYTAPGGFAIATRLEQLDDSGAPRKPPDRWSSDFTPNLTSSSWADELRQYIALLRNKPGLFQILLFVVSDKTIVEGDYATSKAAASNWLAEGSTRLDPAIQRIKNTDTMECTVFVYDFESRRGDNPDSVTVTSLFPPKDQLRKAGILDKLASK